MRGGITRSQPVEKGTSVGIYNGWLSLKSDT